MPTSCCVVGCTVRYTKGASFRGIHFYRIPVAKKQRKRWVQNINRKNWKPSKWDRVCSRHFTERAPSGDSEDEDYAPHLFMGSTKQKTPVPSSTCRSKRNERRSLLKINQHQDLVPQSVQDNRKLQSLEFHDYWRKTPEVANMTSEVTKVYVTPEVTKVDAIPEIMNVDITPKIANVYMTPKLTKVDMISEVHVSELADVGVQTEENIVEQLSALQKKVEDLEEQIKRKTISFEKIKQSDRLTKFYTGLPNFATFMRLFELLQPMILQKTLAGKDRKASSCRYMLLIEEFFAVMLRLKLGLCLQDLAERFSVSVSTISTIFNNWIIVMETELEKIYYYPQGKAIKQTIPAEFKKYDNLRFIIECTELSLAVSASTVPHQKDHRTIKFLVSVTPNGAFNFVSQGWDGKTLDHHIIEHSGFLDEVSDGDIIIADNRFKIGDLLVQKQAHLNVSASSRTPQLITAESTPSREFDSCHWILQRSIDQAKCFHILDTGIHSALKNSISSIFRVCCFLTNFGKSL